MHYAKKLVALLESLRAQVDAAVREGATLKTFVSGSRSRSS